MNSNRSEDQIWLARVRANGLALEHVPNKFINTEMYLAAVTQNGLALAFIPDEDRTPDIYLAAVKQNGDALRYIAEEHQTSDLCLAAVKTTGTAVSHVAAKFLNPDICLAAVTQNGLALPYLPEPLDYSLCLTAVQQNGLALEYVPKDILDAALCLAAIKQNGLAIQFVPEEILTPEMILNAVTQNGLALKHVPKSMLLPEILLAAVSQNGMALEYVPKDRLTPELCSIAIKKNSLALKFVPQALRTLEMYLEAVRQNSMALEFVPEELKVTIVDKIGLKQIIANNFAAHKFLPNVPEYKTVIRDYLANVEHIIVTSQISFDHEINDFIFVYGNHKNRLAKTVHIDTEGLEELLDELKNANVKQVNLVLLDHANEQTPIISGLNVNEVVDVVEKNDFITKVTLLGCNTVKTTSLDEETAMIQKISNSSNSNSNEKRYGLFVLSRELREEDYLNFISKNKLTGTAVVTKQHGQSKIVFIEQHADGNFVASQPVLLTDSQIENLQKLTNKNKKFPFPKEEQRINPIRDIGLPINEHDWEQIAAVVSNVNRFDRKHPEYKKDKAIYPFLSSVTVDESQITGRLLGSFMKKLVDKLVEEKNKGSLGHDVTIKAYPNPIHVDTKDQRMHVTRTHLYTNDYQFSQFFAQTNNIDRKKLDDERRKNIKNMKDKKYQAEKKPEECLFKGINVTVKKS